MTGTDLYNMLIPIYSSPHDDTKEEQREAIAMLGVAMKNGHTFQIIVAKMKKKAKLDIKFKSKLHTAVMNQFWLKEYNENNIAYRKFNIDAI